jgi:hypothetical protein
MKAYVDVAKRRVRGLYVRPRALFAEAVVAALVGGEAVEFPAAAWDVERTVSPGRPITRCTKGLPLTHFNAASSRRR